MKISKLADNICFPILINLNASIRFVATFARTQGTRTILKTK